MYWLTELVRILETRGHIFPTDPPHITQILRDTDAEPTAKLHRRAVMIDRDAALAQRLAAHRQRLRWAMWAASAAWFIFGLLGTYTLMSDSSLNFLLLLIAVLGTNTLFLLIWIIRIILNKKQNLINFPFSGSRDNISLAITELYAQIARLPAFKWTYSAMQHRLALCGLSGMFVAALGLFLVRQYQFNWESTLLNDAIFIKLVNGLAWLPERLGFHTPDTNMIQIARKTALPEHGAAWAKLLLGSLLCYGILPRLVAWGLCVAQKTPLQLDLSLPYYQNILQKWQQKIVEDAADYRADAPSVAPKINLDADGARWAVLLDAPTADTHWFTNALGHDWLDKGILAERTDFAEFLSQLVNEPVQLLIGVRANVAPDRGTVRQLAKLAHAAQSGIIIALLPPENIHAQWFEILRENNWAYLK